MDLLGGTVSLDPLLIVLATWLVLGWRGLDRFVLTGFGVAPDRMVADRNP